MLDIGGLLPLLVLVVVVGLLGGVAGQGQEHVVEGGAVDGEPVHRPAGGIDLVEEGPDLGGTAVGGPPQRQSAGVALDGPAEDLVDRLLLLAFDGEIFGKPADAEDAREPGDGQLARRAREGVDHDRGRAGGGANASAARRPSATSCW